MWIFAVQVPRLNIRFEFLLTFNSKIKSSQAGSMSFHLKKSVESPLRKGINHISSFGRLVFILKLCHY